MGTSGESIRGTCTTGTQEIRGGERYAGKQQDGNNHHCGCHGEHPASSGGTAGSAAAYSTLSVPAGPRRLGPYGSFFSAPLPNSRCPIWVSPAAWQSVTPPDASPPAASPPVPSRCTRHPARSAGLPFSAPLPSPQCPAASGFRSSNYSGRAPLPPPALPLLRPGSGGAGPARQQLGMNIRMDCGHQVHGQGRSAPVCRRRKFPGGRPCGRILRQSRLQQCGQLPAHAGNQDRQRGTVAAGRRRPSGQQEPPHRGQRIHICCRTQPGLFSVNGLRRSEPGCPRPLRPGLPQQPARAKVGQQRPALCGEQDIPR